jgi:hypothetical protein
MSRKIALRSLKNLCAFIGAVALFSYFYNFFVDLRHWHWHWHWYVTLTSAFVCLILWLGFYMVEVHKEAVTHFALTPTPVALGWVSHLRTKPAELPNPQTAMEPGEKLT